MQSPWYFGALRLTPQTPYGVNIHYAYSIFKAGTVLRIKPRQRLIGDKA
jgi:hypothetical protein